MSVSVLGMFACVSAGEHEGKGRVSAYSIKEDRKRNKIVIDTKLRMHLCLCVQSLCVFLRNII